MKKKTNLKQFNKKRNNMDSQEKKNEEMKAAAEEAAEQTKEEASNEAAEEAAPDAEQQEPEQTPEEKLQAQVDSLTQELDDFKDKYLRLSAEFDNYRKRTLKEKAELILNGGEKTITTILPVIDDFERAMATMQKATDVDAVKEGVALIYNKFMQILGQNGVKRKSWIPTSTMPLP